MTSKNQGTILFSFIVMFSFLLSVPMASGAFGPDSFHVIPIDETTRNDRRDGFEPHVIAGPAPGGDGEWYYYDSPSGLLSPGVSNTRRPGNVWLSKDYGQTWEFKEKKNAITDNLPPGIGGSGDTHIAISEGGALFHTDLYLASASVDMSLDGGENWYLNPIASNYVIDDRQWLDIGPSRDGIGDETIYFCFNQMSGLGMVMTKAPIYTNGAVDNYLWTPCNNGLPITTDVTARDNFCVDEESGIVYVTNYAGGRDQIEVWRSMDGGESFEMFPVISASSRAEVQNIFTVIDTDIDGNVYITYSSREHMWVAISTDQAETWAIHQVTNNTSVKVLPWLAAGDGGMVGLAWYEAKPGSAGSPDTQSESWWDVNAAISFNANEEEPVFEIFTVDKAVHYGGIQTTGTGGGSDRDLGDYLSVDVDSHGRFLVSYGEDGDDGPNNRMSFPMYAGQIDGPYLRVDTGPEFEHSLKKDGNKVTLTVSDVEDLEGLGVNNITVNWGDGSPVEEIAEGSVSHNYPDKDSSYDLTVRTTNEIGMAKSVTETVNIGEEDSDWEIAGVSGWLVVSIPLLLLIALGVGYMIMNEKKEDDLAVANAISLTEQPPVAAEAVKEEEPEVADAENAGASIDGASGEAGTTEED